MCSWLHFSPAPEADTWHAEVLETVEFHFHRQEVDALNC